MSLINELEIKYKNKYKDYYKEINRLYVKKKGTGNINWDDRCYIPIGTTMIALHQKGTLDIRKLKSFVLDAGIVAALCGWRANNKKVIVISEFEARKNASKKYSEPIINLDEIFKKIGYGTYIQWDMKEIEDLFRRGKINGVLLSIENDVGAGELELRANVLFDDKHIEPYYLQIKDKMSLTSCLDVTLGKTNDTVNDIMKNHKTVDINLPVLKKGLDSEYIYLLNHLLFSYILASIENFDL